MSNKKDYTIGLDIGTHSVGWAVIDEDFNLVQGKKKINDNGEKRKSKTNLWGARLFEEGDVAADRRLKRGARRRIARRKERLNYLRGIFEEEIYKVDDSFFVRLDESFYQLEDKKKNDYKYRDADGGLKTKEIENKEVFKYPLFKTEKEEKEYYKQFPTIYHLRKHLMENEESDIRKIYLGMHHILKYRGHFVQEGVQINVSNINIKSNIISFIENYNLYIEEKLSEEGNLVEETEFRKNPNKIEIFEEDLNKIERVLKDNKLSNSNKVYRIINEKNADAILKVKSKTLEAIFKAIVGNKVDISSILDCPEYTKKIDEVWDKDANFKFSKETFEDELSVLPFNNDNELRLIIDIKAIYEAVLLSNILNGKSSLSEAMVEKYESHKKELKMLKTLIKESYPEAFNKFFKDNFAEKDKQGKYISGNYSTYISGFAEKDISKPISQQAFYKFLTDYFFDKFNKYITVNNIELLDDKGKLKKLSNSGSGQNFNTEFLKLNEDKFTKFKEFENLFEILKKIELETYLVKQRMYKNGAIPYQIHEHELLEIIKKQSGNSKFEFLNNEVKIEKDVFENKIHSLFKFRIPYYVGTLAKNPNWKRQGEKLVQSGSQSKNSWLERKDEKITPWNFEDIVNKDKSAENFITRMTGECTYLLGEKALPKNSLIYQKYKLLNELTKIKIGIDGEEKTYHFLDKETKEKALKNLFYKPPRSVSKKRFNEFLHKELGYQENMQIVRGVDGRGFLNNLSSHIELAEILGDEFVLENETFLEEIIRAKTILEDKTLRREKIKKINSEYHDLLDSEAITKIARKSYTGWGSLSKKLIVDLKSEVQTSVNSKETKTILEFLLDDLVYNIKEGRPQIANRNFGQLISDDSLSFKRQIKSWNANYFEENGLSESVEDKINALAGSPALKKGIKQTFKVVEELVKILGRDNIKNIALEVAKEANEKANNHSRYKQLEEFKKIFDADILKQYNELGDEKTANKKLSNERLFLYFIQNGKCLYTQKTLDIGLLSTYEVDHIVPKTYIKDDSFSNKALVLRDENQRKTGIYPFADTISQEVKDWWKSLYNQNKDLKMSLFTKKKYEALTRTAPFSEFEKEGFINRQIVETRQIMKHVKNLLEEEFGETTFENEGKTYRVPKVNVLSMKSQFTDGIRKSNAFYKSRDINDYHHAHDAYIIANVAQFLKNEINYGDERTNIITQAKKEKRNLFMLIEEKDKASETNKQAKEARNKNSMLINWFNKSATHRKIDKETGEILESRLIEYMREVFNYKNCNVVRMYSEERGEFFNESIYKQAQDLIPTKKGLNPEKYGGTKSIKPAYSVLVKYKTIEKKKEVSKFGIFAVMRIEKIEAEENLTKLISGKNPEWKDIEIVERRILNNQIVITDKGIRRMFRSWNKTDGVVFNKGQQIVLAKKDYLTLCHVLELDQKGYPEIKNINDQDKLNLYNVLLEQLKNEEVLSDNAIKAFEELKGKFLALPLKNILEKTTVKEIGQREVIQGMISYLSAGKVGSKDGNLDKLDKRLNNKIIKIGSKSLENYTVLHQSITGLHETRITLK